MKKTRVLLMACAIMLSFCLGAAATGNLQEIKAFLNYGITVKLDGEEQIMHDVNGKRVYPITYEGTTYVPVRAVSNMLGIDVNWDGTTNTVLLGENPAPEVQYSASGLKRGILVGNNYTNTFLGIGFNAPDGWRYLSDAEIEELTGYALSDDLQEVMEQTGCFFDVYGANEELGANFNIAVESKTAEAKNMDFYSLYKATLNSLEKSMASFYDTCTVKERNIKVGNTTFYGYDIISTYQGRDICQTGFLIDLGDCAAAVTVTGRTPQEVQNVLYNFYTVQIE